MIHDHFKEIQLILSGSSSLDLNSAIKEPQTGRKWKYNLYPISWEEFQNQQGYLDTLKQLDDRLIYGMYPDVINNIGEEKQTLKTLTGSYLYQGILTLTNIKKPEVLIKLIQVLAYQIGSEVSYNELSNMLQVNKETISSYIQLLEKAFVVFRLNPLSKNLRNEIKTNKKIYFYVNGIRNAVINTYNPIALRNDKGALWKNFLISERIKHINYHKEDASYYFWRTKQQQEVDWIEEREGRYDAYEFKWNGRKKTKFPKKFTDNYPTTTSVIDRKNFTDFIT